MSDAQVIIPAIVVAYLLGILMGWFMWGGDGE